MGPASPRPPEPVPVAPLAFGGSWCMPVALGFLKVAEHGAGVGPCSETCCFLGGCASVGAGAEGRGRLPRGRAQPGW